MRETDVSIDFSSATRNKFEDKYNYTLAGAMFSKFSTRLPYYIYYSDSETSMANIIAWLFISFSVLLLGPMFAYLYFFT